MGTPTCCAALGGGAAVVSEDQLADKEKARTGQGMSDEEVAHEPGAALREAESERRERSSNNRSRASKQQKNMDDGDADGMDGVDSKPEQASSAGQLNASSGTAVSRLFVTHKVALSLPHVGLQCLLGSVSLLLPVVA